MECISGPLIFRAFCGKWIQGIIDELGRKYLGFSNAAVCSGCRWPYFFAGFQTEGNNGIHLVPVVKEGFFKALDQDSISSIELRGGTDE